MENKKTKKYYYQTNKKNFKKNLKSLTEIFLKIKILKKKLC